MRRRPDGATRQRLIEVAVELLVSEGPDALSTTRLASEVGIVQSGFYAHFASIAELSGYAAVVVVDRVRSSLAAWMEQLRELVEVGSELDARDVDDFYGQVLALMCDRWTELELLVRHRHDPTPLGRRMHAVHDELLADVSAHLDQLGARFGVATDGWQARLDVLAALVTGLVLHAAEALATDPRQSLDVVARMLTRSAEALLKPEYEAMAAAGVPAP